MRASNKRLTILSKFEQFVLYALPDFNDPQRKKYFTFSSEEVQFILSRSKLYAQVFCAIQIGYFKAKQTFFHFKWQDIPAEDIAFILNRYFSDRNFTPVPITKYEYYLQHKKICSLFQYQPWSKQFANIVNRKLAKFTRRDINITFVLTELLSFLKKSKIIRPNYTVLQDIISRAISREYKRLTKILKSIVDYESNKALEALLKEQDTLSKLAALKQDTKDFKYGMISEEIEKFETLKSLYKIAKEILPTLKISQQNITHFASLAHYYTIYELRRFRPETTNLYLLCYVWLRYQQITDNLVNAFCYKVTKFYNEAKSYAQEEMIQDYTRCHSNLPLIGNVLELFLQDFEDATKFESIKKMAFNILSRDQLQKTVKYLSNKPSEISLRWEFVDKNIKRITKNLRPLFTKLDFSSIDTNSIWITIIQHFKESFEDFSHKAMFKVIPKNLKPYLVNENAEINRNCYEFWLYLKTSYLLKGELYLNDSIKYKHLDHELISLSSKKSEIKELDLPLFKTTIKKHLKERIKILNNLWITFNEKLNQGKLSHLKFNHDTQDLIWNKIRANDKKVQEQFYNQIPLRSIIDIFRFVDKKCNFLSTFLHLQPRYAKQEAEKDILIASIMAQAMNYGSFKMAETSDIDYHNINYTYKQYLRLATLTNSNDAITNAVTELNIFKYYCFDLNAIYGAVDGQKYELEYATLKARHSTKHKGRGVVAYTLLSNHIPLQTQVIGGNEHESYYVYDILQSNTSDIKPSAISGDMHSINKANFAILSWYGYEFTPRFRNLYTQLNHLYCAKKLSKYRKYLVKPVGQIKEQLIIDEWPNLKRIMATLALKETTQSIIIKKLCTYTHTNKMRQALFEYDKLERSIYTLKYLSDSKLQQIVHHSQNRIESYHNLRAAIAQVNGKKELHGKTDIDIEISNQCGRLVANAIIYYNSAILSDLLEKQQLYKSDRMSKKLRKISPVAWQHIHLLGHYNFKKRSQQLLDLDALMENIKI